MGSGNTHGRATAGQVRNRAIAVLYFVAFGELGLLLGLDATPYDSPFAEALCGVLGLTLVTAALALMRRAKRLPADAPDASYKERSRRMLRAVNIIQWVSVATATSILSILHLQDYLVTAIAIIVGLNLFPLAGTFRYRQHYLTGACLVVWPLACLVSVPRAKISAVTALGAGMVLLLSAVAIVIRSIGIGSAVERPLEGASGHPAA